jgi:hypothetical protein
MDMSRLAVASATTNLKSIGDVVLGENGNNIGIFAGAGPDILFLFLFYNIS